MNQLCCNNPASIILYASTQQKELKALQKKVKDLEEEKLELQKRLQQEKETTESSSAEPDDQEVQEKARFVDMYMSL